MAFLFSTPIIKLQWPVIAALSHLESIYVVFLPIRTNKKLPINVLTEALFNALGSVQHYLNFPALKFGVRESYSQVLHCYRLVAAI